MDAVIPSPPPPIQTQVCSSPAGPSGLQQQQQHLAIVGSGAVGGDLNQAARSSGWLDGIFGCFRPVFWTISSKAEKGIVYLTCHLSKRPDGNDVANIADEWEIPSEALRELEWLGSGAQGAVYKCRLRQEIVAVKRVKDKKEADIRHLRQLHHPNIIRFKSVAISPYLFSLKPPGTIL